MSLTKQLRYFYYNSFNLHQLEKKTKLYADSPVVSLTTVPKRISFLKPTLVSLLRQTIPPKEIQINLSKEFFKDTPIPEYLQNLERIKICWTEKDMGPATKYIPTLERYQNTQQLIIIVDDDMFYSKHLVSDLVRADKESKGQKVFCINGFTLPEDLSFESRPSDATIKKGSRRVAVVEGCGGFTLRPHFVKVTQLKDLTGAPVRSFFDDDIWLSGYLSREKIEKYQIVTGKRKSLINTIESAISGDRGQLQTDLMRHFKNDWLPEEFDRKS